MTTADLVAIAERVRQRTDIDAHRLLEEVERLRLIFADLKRSLPIPGHWMFALHEKILEALEK